MNIKKYFFVPLIISIFYCPAEARYLSVEPVTVRKVYTRLEETKRLSTITYEQAKEDLEDLCYILETGYSGYDTMCKNGYEPEKFRRDFLSNFNPSSSISRYQFMQAMNSELCPYVQDSHFSFFSDDKGFKPTLKKSAAYTNIYLSKNETESSWYFNNGSSDIKGKKYDGPEDYLFYYPSKGENFWRLGKLVPIGTTATNFQFNSLNKTLPVINEIPINGNYSIYFNALETEDSGYLAISSFMIDGSSSERMKNCLMEINKFLSYGTKWRDKKNIILDIRSNGGGLAFYPARFFYALYDSKINYVSASSAIKCPIDDWINGDFVQEISVESPASENFQLAYQQMYGYSTYEQFKNLNEFKENPVKRLKIKEPEKFSFENDSSDFKGKIIILANSYTASAAEEACLMAKILFKDQAVIIGENTMGCLEYVNILTGYLGNTGIQLYIPHNKIINLSDYPWWHGESYGVYPDIWATGSDLRKSVFLMTKDQKMNQMLNGIKEGWR